MPQSSQKEILKLLTHAVCKSCNSLVKRRPNIIPEIRCRVCGWEEY